MSAIGLPSNSSAEAMRPMSAMERAPRNASRKRSVTRFSEPNSKILVISRVQERTEARARPTSTTLATTLASMNMVTGVNLPACLMVTGAPVASVAEAGAADAEASTAALEAAGALEPVV